jgi:hypothetical protein
MEMMQKRTVRIAERVAEREDMIADAPDRKEMTQKRLWEI